MNAKNKLLAVAGLMLGLFLGLGFLVRNMLHHGEEKRDVPANPNSYEVQLVGLVNRNAAPAIVEVSMGSLPAFPADFDWKEQDRVAKLWGALMKNDDPALFEEFLKQTENKSYALTATCFDPYSADNLTVGQLCSRAAWARFQFRNARIEMPDNERGELVVIDLGFADLRSWREGRPEKSLYDLQLEALNTALKNIEAIENIPEESRAQLRSELRGTLTRLSNSGKPLFFHVEWDECELFNSETAERAARNIRKERGLRPEQ